MECQIINHVNHFHLDQIKVVHTSIRRPRCPQHRRNQVQPKRSLWINLPVQVLSGRVWPEKSQEGNKSKFYLLVVLLKGSHILSGFAELSFLHALANIPNCCIVTSPFLLLWLCWFPKPGFFKTKFYQWTKALLAYIRSNLWSNLNKTK